MTAQEYIESKLLELKQPLNTAQPKADKVEDEIVRLILSKKFRKYSVSQELREHVRNAVRINVEANRPINITFLHGAYKLWRLDESPHVDWAELFSLMYYTKWVKPVCEIYGPGVVFDFFVDDFIVPILNNVPTSDVDDYLDSYKKLIDYIGKFQPDNLKMTITTVGEQFESKSAIDQSIEANLEKVTKNTPGGLPVLNDAQKAMVELNTKTTEEQLRDPKWREKVVHLHNAYSLTKAETGYYKNRPEKILAFTQSLPVAIGVGTTKDSIAKFWVGVGVLRKKDGDFRQTIYSPSQLEKTEFSFEQVSIQGLDAKNFKKIRISH